jgi:cytochrome c biogenesis protein CcdA
MVYDAMIISLYFVFGKLLRVVYCFVITTAIGGANIQHRRYTNYVAGIKSVSSPNRSNPTPTKRSSKADHGARQR